MGKHLNEFNHKYPNFKLNDFIPNSKINPYSYIFIHKNVYDVSFNKKDLLDIYDQMSESDELYISCSETRIDGVYCSVLNIQIVKTDMEKKAQFDAETLEIEKKRKERDDIIREYQNAIMLDSKDKKDEEDRRIYESLKKRFENENSP